MFGVTDKWSRSEADLATGETLVNKLEELKMVIINSLEKLLVRSLIAESGDNFNFDAVANEAVTFITDLIHNILNIDAKSTFNDVIRKMTSFAKNHLITELGACNIVPKLEDGAHIIIHKKGFLKMLNLLQGMVISITDNIMLTQGVDDRPSTIRGAGLMAKLNAEYHEIHNKVAETDRRLDLATRQIAMLSSTVTDQESNESNKMLNSTRIVRGYKC